MVNCCLCGLWRRRQGNNYFVDETQVFRVPFAQRISVGGLEKTPPRPKDASTLSHNFAEFDSASANIFSLARSLSILRVDEGVASGSKRRMSGEV
jgi:hypothetical protein